MELLIKLARIYMGGIWLIGGLLTLPMMIAAVYYAVRLFALLLYYLLLP